MDLGATLCTTRAPRCMLCPAVELCAAARAGTQERYPVKTRRIVRKRRTTVWLDLRWRGATWLVRRPSAGIWAGLWSWPEFATMAEFDAAAAGWPGGAESLDAFTHVLTHLDWTFQPVRWTVPAEAAAESVAGVTAAWPEGRWFEISDAAAMGLPAPLRKRLVA